MSFPRYPQYKDSGVDWLGSVPAHWEKVRTKEVVQFSTGWTPPTGNDAAFSGANMWANISDLGPRVLNETAKQISDEAIADSRINPTPKDSLLFSFKLSIGQVSFAGCDMFTNEAIATFLPSSRLSLEFAYYAFPLFLVQNAAENIYGAKLLNQELIRSARFALPPLPEQREIAGFLDRETGKIDALVAEQERLLELLKEKRQAVISHAVTRGLNPNAPLKPSGLAWLGDVPAHWEICMLKRVFRSVDYGISDSLDAEGPIAILRMGNIENGQVVMDDLKYTKEVDKGLLLQCGDLLYNRTNSLDLIGKVGMFRGSEDGPVSFASYLVRIRTVNDSLPEFFAYLLNTEGVLGLARANAFVAIGQCNLNPTRYGQIEIALPPLSEQRAIVAHLDAATAQFDALTAAVERALALLQERRTALISAAVTGQIDVRAAT